MRTSRRPAGPIILVLQSYYKIDHPQSCKPRSTHHSRAVTSRKTTLGLGRLRLSRSPPPSRAARSLAMDDGQDGDSKKKTKPQGNPYPRRGAVKKQIIKDWWIGGGGGGNGDDGNGGGGDAGGSSTTAAD